MRDYHRRETERPRLNLVRGVDGRLRLADSPGSDRLTNRQASVRSATIRSGAPHSAPMYEHRPGVRDSVDGIFEKVPRVPPQPDPVVYHNRERQLKEQEEVRYPAPPRISMPRISLPKLPLAKLKMLAGKRQLLAAASVVVVMVLGSSMFSWVGQGGQTQNNKENEVAEQPQTPSVLNAAGSQAPQFDAVLPQGKTIEELGGWVRVSPADKDPVFAFVDVVNGVQLNVSQQELPQNLRTDTAKKVAELAEGFAANEKIMVGNGLEAYIGTSIRGPQSVIFVKNGLLILIKSSSKLTHEQWASYINSLH